MPSRIAGVLFTAIAAGSIVGGVAALHLARRVPLLVLGCAGFALMALPLWCLLAPRSAALFAAVAAAFGFGTQVGVSPITAVLTTQSPESLWAQSVSAFLPIANAGVPAGSALTGVCDRLRGIRCHLRRHRRRYDRCDHASDSQCPPAGPEGVCPCESVAEFRLTSRTLRLVSRLRGG